jgi:glycosyltransferase involved in cell wall biosynthesis
MIEANFDSLKDTTTLKNPFFSVIVPTYNRAHSIGKAIESILNQTFQDFEIIVIDDCSSDSTSEVMSLISNVKVNYFRNEKNLERCVSRNRGIQKSIGKYICFLDSDDYHLPNHLEIIYKEIKRYNEPKAFFFTNSWNESLDGLKTERSCPLFLDYNPYTYFLHFTVNPQRWAIHREVLIENLFDPEVVICEDMDTSLRIVAKGIPIYHINVRTTVYVAAADSFTVSDVNKSEKELFYLRKIFTKKELKGLLPRQETNRLLSMCYYFLAVKSEQKKSKLKTLLFGVRSFVTCPRGYNGNTNKTLLVICIYSIPFFGIVIRSLIRLFKK